MIGHQLLRRKLISARFFSSVKHAKDISLEKMNESTKQSWPSGTGHLAAEALPLKMVMTQMMMHSRDYYDPMYEHWREADEKAKEIVKMSHP